MKILKAFSPLLAFFLLASCSARDVYESTESWRLDECKEIGNLDERMTCEQRARSNSPNPDEQQKGSPRDPAY